MTLRLPKLYIAWTRFKLNLAVRLIASVNRQAASAYALWDDAQDTMERCVPEPKTLLPRQSPLDSLTPSE